MHFLNAGGRTSKDIVKWLEKKGGAEVPGQELMRFDDLEKCKEWAKKAQESDPDVDPVVAFLGIFSDVEGEGYKNFQAVSFNRKK